MNQKKKKFKEKKFAKNRSTTWIHTVCVLCMHIAYYRRIYIHTHQHMSAQHKLCKYYATKEKYYSWNYKQTQQQQRWCCMHWQRFSGKLKLVGCAAHSTQSQNWINFLISATILSKQCMHFEQLNHLVCIIDSLCNFASKFRYLLFD